MTTMYKLQKDVAGYNGFGLQFSDQKYTATLAANADTSLTVPATGVLGAPADTINKFIAIVGIESGATVFCALNVAASAPAGAAFAASASEIIIGGQYYARIVQAGDVLHFLSVAGNTDISVAFYAMPAS